MIGSIVQIINVIMVNVFIISMIQNIQHFVNVKKDGLVDTVLFLVIVHVHPIHYVLAYQQIIDRFVFVQCINGVLDVFFMIRYVNQPILHDTMVDNVFLLIDMLYQRKNLLVFVLKVIMEKDVK
jgi:hypothetical protein